MPGTKASMDIFLKKLAKMNRVDMSQMLRQLDQEKKRRKKKKKHNKN